MKSSVTNPSSIQSPKDALHSISYGIYVIGSQFQEEQSLFMANCVFQISSDPIKFSICSHKSNHTTDIIKKSGYYSFSVMSEAISSELITAFGYKSSSDTNKLDGFESMQGQFCPILLSHAISWFECEVVDQVDLGSHIMFIGEIIGCNSNLRSESPLTYFRYQELNHGSSPANSPTHISVNDDNTIESKGQGLIKHVCSVCGFVFDSEKGDSLGGVDAGIDFLDLPDDYVCPLCGADKSMFYEK